MDLPRNLRRPVPNEKKTMAAFLAREVERVADVKERVVLRAEAGRCRLTVSKPVLKAPMVSPSETIIS
jgi:hypothetical protein